MDGMRQDRLINGLHTTKPDGPEIAIAIRLIENMSSWEYKSLCKRAGVDLMVTKKGD